MSLTSDTRNAPSKKSLISKAIKYCTSLFTTNTKDGLKEFFSIENFEIHCRSRKCARVLIIEPTLSHQETLPALVYYFNTLGIGVDVLLRSQQRKHRKISSTLKNKPIPDAIFFYVLDADTLDRVAVLINEHPYEYLHFNTVYEYWLNDGIDRIYSLITQVAKKAFITVHHYEKYMNSDFSHPLISRDNAFVLGEYLSNSYGIDLLLPAFFYQETTTPDYSGKILFTCVGGFDPNRRDYQMLLDACIALNDKGYRDKYSVRLLGSPYIHQPYVDFLNAVHENGLGETIFSDTECTFEYIFSTMRKSHFQLFLINPEMDGASEYFDNQITGGMNLSLAFSTIPVVDKRYAVRWRFDEFSVAHVGSHDFSNAMCNILSNPGKYLPLRSKIESKRSQLTQISLNNLKQKL